MGLAAQQPTSSWVNNPSPVILSEIFSPKTSVAIWNRKVDPVINDYFERAFHSLGMGFRGVFSMATLKDELSETLPEYEGKQHAVEDIYLLSDMLTCLFDCDTVGLRLVPLTKAMCPKFHTDNIPVRLVNTYMGGGTEWLPAEAVQPVSAEVNLDAEPTASSRYHYESKDIQQMAAFDVGLLKGKAWEQQEHMAALHRSCQVGENEKRVLLSLDPM